MDIQTKIILMLIYTAFLGIMYFGIYKRLKSIHTQNINKTTPPVHEMLENNYIKMRRTIAFSFIFLLIISLAMIMSLF